MDFLQKQIRKKNLMFCNALIMLLIILDQLTKAIAIRYLLGKPVISFLAGFVQFEYAENRGAFLSLGANLSEEMRTWIFVFGVVGILAFCAYSLWKFAHEGWSAFAFSLLIAGGMGNLIDRVSQGYVVDFVHMGFSNWLRTGVFNVADMAISLGVVILLIRTYLKKDEDVTT